VTPRTLLAVLVLSILCGALALSPADATASPGGADGVAAGLEDHVTAGLEEQVTAGADAPQVSGSPDCPAVSCPIGNGTSTGPSRPRLLEVYPNPVPDGDRGEFVTVAVPVDISVESLELADEHARVGLSTNGTADRDASAGPAERGTAGHAESEAFNGPRVLTFTTAPAVTAPLTNRRIRRLSDALQLANDGEFLELRLDGTVVHRVAYDRAPEGEVYDVTTDTWHPLGATQRPVVTAGPGTVEAFVLPDEPDRAVDFLNNASERIRLAGYTFAAPRVVDALVAAHERGVSVEVLVDGSPVGGMSGAQVAALDRLDRSGVTVRVLGGDRKRYRYHHAKYAVVDDRALVTTENWKPSGLGGTANRGWAAITGQQSIVAGLLATYRADTDWNDTRRWSDHDPTVVRESRTTGVYPTTFDAERVTVERTQLLLAPDNAEAHLQNLIANATESLEVKQMTIGRRGQPLLRAVIDAAERGVDVRVLLSGAWYAREENEELAAWLREQARIADLPLAVRVASPDDAFEKIHAKGLVVDGDTAVLGSINWNNNSIRNNREVALVLEGEEAGGYFGAVFDADWRRTAGADGGRDIPFGLALAGVGAAAVAILAARRIEFESGTRRR